MMMSSLSNGYGAIHYDDVKVYGRRSGMGIGELPRPLTPEDAKLLWAMCLSRVAGRQHPLSLTDSLTMSKLMGDAWVMALCEQCVGSGETMWPAEDGGSPLLICGPCDGWGWKFYPSIRSST